MNQSVPRVGFVMEQALGHVTYSRNLASAFAQSGALQPTWLNIPFTDGGPLDRVPGVRSNWTVRASLRAAQRLRAAGGAGRYDALFFHTQSVALLSPLIARRTPVILSLDATPLGYDRIGAAYGHVAIPESRAERLKQRLYRAVFRRANALTTWSRWAKDSLVREYEIAPELVTVIYPGIDLDRFRRTDGATRGRNPLPRVLFVGGDFVRKGGPLLLEAMRGGLAGRCELHLVTGASVPQTPGVVVHTNLGPNDPRLLALYRDADLFALPTAGDCLAVALGEALAAGLPCITTTVAAQPEAVRDGHTGIIIAPDDADALGAALRRLLDDADLRARMGQQARLDAAAHFDVRVNAARVADVIAQGISRSRDQFQPSARGHGRSAFVG